MHPTPPSVRPKARGQTPCLQANERRRLVLDMVHHNPGEPAFSTAFTDPSHLREYGFNGQVFKHINCVATFAATGLDLFPDGSPEGEWLKRMTAHLEAEISAAKAQGLRVYYHIDLFVLPRRLVEHFRAEITDPQTGRVDLNRPRTLELHRVMFDELTERFPSVDGYIVRVGETYLFDTPYHVGNGPIPSSSVPWTPTYAYPEALSGGAAPGRWGEAQEDAYVRLLTFLRGQVCERNGRDLIFRTWDIFPDRLHACPDHYLRITERIEEHPRLIFSIKHTALDFWRRVKVNECLGRGRHSQIIEVQCQREYEGKGAYPNYVMAGVIDGFEENSRRVGLRQLLDDPRVVGVYSWSRGGGWYGPYIKDELWCDLNAYVLAQYVSNPARTEPEIFDDYARDRLQLNDADRARFRRLCELSAAAVLKGRYCEAFDRALEERVLPTACWMRDDRLGGRHQLGLVLEHLEKCDGFEAALSEKQEAVKRWDEIAALAGEISWTEARQGGDVRMAAEYGRLLFAIVRESWRIMIAGYRGDRSGRYDAVELGGALSRYRHFWAEYTALGLNPRCASLYRDEYFSLPGQPAVPGIGETVSHYEQKLGAAPVNP